MLEEKLEDWMKSGVDHGSRLKNDVGRARLRDLRAACMVLKNKIDAADTPEFAKSVYKLAVKEANDCANIQCEGLLLAVATMVGKIAPLIVGVFGPEKMEGIAGG